MATAWQDDNDQDAKDGNPSESFQKYMQSIIDNIQLPLEKSFTQIKYAKLVEKLDLPSAKMAALAAHKLYLKSTDVVSNMRDTFGSEINSELISDILKKAKIERPIDDVETVD